MNIDNDTKQHIYNAFTESFLHEINHGDHETTAEAALIAIKKALELE